jgi:integrase
MYDAVGLVFSESKNVSRHSVDLLQRAVEATGESRWRDGTKGWLRMAESGPRVRFEQGPPLEAQNILNRHFKPLLKRSGLPSIRWYDLRHTCAILLLARGTNPTYGQKSLGQLDHVRPCFLRHRLTLPADVTIETDTASLQ